MSGGNGNITQERTARDHEEDSAGANSRNGHGYVVCFAVLTGLIGMMSGVVKSVMNGRVEDIMVHFNMKEVIAEPFFSAEFAGTFVGVIFTGFVATYLHIPRATGIAGITMGIGMAISGFVGYSKSYDWVDFQGSRWYPDFYTCYQNRSDMEPEPVYEDKLSSTAGLSLSMFCYGVLTTIQWGPLLFLFVDNNIIDKRKVGLYLAMSMALTSLYRPIGYLFNQHIKDIAVDLKDQAIPPENDRFVTAWWLGPVIFGFLTSAVSIPLLFLPTDLLSRSEQLQQLGEANANAVHEDVKIAQVQKDGSVQDMEEAGCMDKVKFYFGGVRRVFSHPSFILLVIVWSFVLIPVYGISLVALQYTQSEYNVNGEEAEEADAVSISIATMLAAFVSALLCTRMHRKRDYLQFILACVFLSFALLPVSFFLGCDNAQIVGLDNTQQQQPACLVPCDQLPKLPSCGADGKNYKSPCFAGCQYASIDGVSYDFCTGLENGTAVVKGLCQDECHDNFVKFNIVHTVSVFLYKMADIPKVLLALRMIATWDRGLAFSILGFAGALSSTIGPVALGELYNANCRLWMDDTAQEMCLYYDRENIRLLKTGVEFNTYLISFVLWLFLLKLNSFVDNKTKETSHRDNNSHHRHTAQVESDNHQHIKVGF